MQRPDEAGAWRENVLEAMLSAIAIVAPAVAGLGALLRPTPRLDPPILLVVAASVALVAIKLARSQRFGLRAGLTIATMLAVCLAYTAIVGFSLGAAAGMVTSLVIAVMLLGRRVAFVLLVGTGLALAATGAATHAGWFTPGVADTDPRIATNWVRMGVTFTLLTGCLAVAVDYVVRHIEKKYAELRSAYDELAELTRKLETAKEEERRRVARELHDDLGQDLTVLKLGLKSGKTTPFSDPVRIVDGLIVKVRELSRALRPALLDEVGLAPALSAYLEEQSTISGVKMELETPGFDGRLPGELEIACFRLVQEAITNALRHAEPKHLSVRIERANGVLGIRIQDDGRGFSGSEALARAAHEGHVGVVGMRERARALGGTFRIHSEPSKGTRIDVELPMPAT